MKHTQRALLSLAVIALSSCVAEGHRVLTQGNGKLAIVDREGLIEWEMPWGGIHDIHALPSGNIMVQEGSGSVVEINRETKEVCLLYTSPSPRDRG